MQRDRPWALVLISGRRRARAVCWSRGDACSQAVRPDGSQRRSGTVRLAVFARLNDGHTGSASKPSMVLTRWDRFLTSRSTEEVNQSQSKSIEVNHLTAAAINHSPLFEVPPPRHEDAVLRL